MIEVSQTWCIDHEAHLLQHRVIVNSHSSKNRYSETIPSLLMGALPILLNFLYLRLDILRSLVRRAGLDAPFDFENLTQITEFWSGAEFARLISILSSETTETVSDSVIRRVVALIAASISINERKTRMKQLVRWTLRHCPDLELTQDVRQGWSCFVSGPLRTDGGV